MRVSMKSVIAVCALAVVVLAGCSSSEDPATMPDSENTTETTPAELVIGSSEPVPDLVPGRQSNAFGLTMSVFTSLTFLDSEGELSYRAAESVESDDQITWTITLKDGWTFHDGTPVTAQDYVDSWNTVAYGPNAFANSGQFAAIEGYADLNPTEGEPTAKELSGLAVVDDLSFTVTLTRPDSQFPLQVSQAQTAFYPMPKSAFDDLEAYGKKPIGNGPFVLTTEWVEGEPLIAERYADYKGDAPTLDKITWVPYTDRLTAYTDALAGNLDLAAVPATRLKQVATDFAEDQIYSFDGSGISYLGVPFWDERYQDIRVRQAISMALDRDAINQAIYGGYNTPATSWTPSVMPGTPTGICGEFCEYDPDKAAALLKEAGGFEGQLTVNYPGGSGLDDLYNAIANSLRQNLGVDAVAVPSIGWAEFSDARKTQGIDGLFFSRWGALYPSQQSTLRAIFSDEAVCLNCGGAPIEGLDAALIDADTNGSEDGAAYADAQQLIADAFPVPPLFEESYNYVTSERVESLIQDGVGEPVLSAVVVAED